MYKCIEYCHHRVTLPKVETTTMCDKTPKQIQNKNSKLKISPTQSLD